MVVNAGGGCVVVYFFVNSGTKTSGPALNPTLGLINSTFNAYVRNPAYLKYSICYFFGPLIGSSLGALFLKFFMIPKTAKV